ncbi:MAG: hypothetical protein HYY01_00530 [Chloroflexi bacterium]|nr:hypothetical protein [Chloroflexota bacterium]
MKRRELWSGVVGVVLSVPLVACGQPAQALPAGIDSEMLQEAQAQVDFPIAVPHYLPLELRLTNVVVAAPPVGNVLQVMLTFASGTGGPGFTLEQMNGTVTPGDHPLVEMTIQKVPGQLYEDPDRNGRHFVSLTWNKAGMGYAVSAFLERGLTKAEFLKIAESIAEA